MSARAEFLAGVRAELPILLGVVPFGLIYGVLALTAGLTPAAALAMSSIVFAGSAQFVGIQLIGAGAPPLVIILTTFVVNLRHVLYSASLAPHLRHLSRAWKWLLAYLLTDEAYVVTVIRYESPQPPEHRHWFFLGAGLTLWSTWQASTAAGIFLGAQTPESWSLDFAIALTFIALLAPALKDRAGLAAGLGAGLVALAANGLPLRLGLVAAALAGVLIGMAVESNLPARRAPHQRVK